MGSRNSLSAIGCCAVGLLFAGCQTSNRWLSQRLEPSFSNREIAVSVEPTGRSGQESRTSLENHDEGEITLTSNEQSAPHIEVAAIVDVADMAADDVVVLPEAGSTLSLATLEQMALENNPAIRQAIASVSKAAGYRDQVGRLPNPVLAYNGQQLWDRGTDQHMATLTQDFVTAHKLRLNQQVLNQSVQVQLWEVEAQRYRVLTDVRTNYYETLAAQKQLLLTTEFQVVAAKGVKVAESRKAALEGSQPEILQAEIQLQEVELQQQQSGFQVRAAWKELAATVGLPDLSLAKLDGELPKTAEARDWDAMYEQLASSSPELRAAQSRVDRASANLCRQDVQAIPNLQLQLSAGQDNGAKSSMVQVAAGMPVPVFNQNQGNISAAHAEFSRASQDYQRLRLSLKARLARAAQDYDSARAAVLRYEGQILPKAMQSLTLSEQAYSASEFNFLQVLTARRIYFDSNLRAVDFRRQLAQSGAKLDGLLLSGGLSDTVDTGDDDGLRGQALSGE